MRGREEGTENREKKGERERRKKRERSLVFSGNSLHSFSRRRLLSLILSLSVILLRAFDADVRDVLHLSLSHVLCSMKGGGEKERKKRNEVRRKRES